MLDLNTIKPEETALLIVDLEEQFLRRSPLYAALARKATNFAETLRPHGLKTVWIATVPRNSDLIPSPHDLSERFQQAGPDFKSDDFYYKPSYSAFAYTTLKRDLKNAGITSLLVAGIFTFDCVEATIMDARGNFDTALVWDMTADARFTSLSSIEQRMNAGIRERASLVYSEHIIAKLSGDRYHLPPQSQMLQSFPGL